MNITYQYSSPEDLKLFGENSKAVEFLNEKIKDDPDGEKGEVIADESQMIYLLVNLAAND
jgi:hypothetical protein